MSHLTLKVTVDPGTKIEDAFGEAISLASKVFQRVEFVFNDVECIAFPFGDTATGVQEYQAAIKNKSEYKFAFARIKEVSNGQ